MNRGSDPSPPDAPLRRVVFFSPGWPPGNPPNGIVTYVNNMRHGLEALGVESHVIAGRVAPGSNGEAITDLHHSRPRSLGRRILESALGRIAGPEANHIHVGRPVGFALRSLYRRWPFDLFEVEESFGFSAVARRFIAAPTIVRLHGPWFLNGKALGVPEDSTFHRRVAHEGRAVREAVAISSPSRDVLRQTCSRYGFEPAFSAVIPNPGPDLAQAQTWTLSRADRNAVLFVGRFDRHKGGDLMIEAFRRLLQSHPDCRLVFVGPDPGLKDDRGRAWTLPEFLIDRIPDQAARSRVAVLGMQTPERISELRRQCMLSVVPSRYENLPMTVVEAMAFGCPLVASDAGGIGELVRHGVSARLFRTGDVEALAQSMSDVMADPAAAAQLGESARREYEARLAPEPVVRRMLEFYREVLARARVPGHPTRG